MLAERIKPCIVIGVALHNGSEKKLREVKAGMEEEGIPYSMLASGDLDAIDLAYQAAASSKLGVGVGIGPETLCIHYNKLPAKEPLFVSHSSRTPAQWRHFGYNAARLVKGIPFKDQADESVNGPITDLKQLVAIVQKMVKKMMQESAQDHGEVKSWSTTR